ncbi:hypothetical protein XENTR_v10012760 [Xenopus tropicalis]|nr:hypothetical protein XENTR_v10012760 [Xenopus tropicalis]
MQCHVSALDTMCPNRTFYHPNLLQVEQIRACYITSERLPRQTSPGVSVKSLLQHLHAGTANCVIAACLGQNAVL